MGFEHMFGRGFYIGSLFIAWYGVIIAAAILVAFLIGSYLYKLKDYRDDIPYQILLTMVPIAIIGSRLTYIIFYPGTNFFDFRGGGLTIYGAIGFAVLALLVYARFRKVGFFTLCDGIVVGLILAQAIGRWGNFTNQELYGWEVGFNFFPLTVNINGSNHLALFFIESVLNIAGFVFLFWFFTRKQKKFGTTTALYFIWYGTVRAILEHFRTPESITLIGNNDIVINRVFFLVSLLLIAVGCVILYLNKRGLINQENGGVKAQKKTKQGKGETDARIDSDEI